MRNKIKIVIILATAGLMLPLAGSASNWQSLGPEGGYFMGCVTDTADPTRITAITNNPACFYRSGDRGVTWSKIGTLECSYITDISSFDFDRIYVLAGGNCYFTTNAGSSWTSRQLSTYDSNRYTTADVILAHPSDPATVYAAGNTRVYSTTGAATNFTFFRSDNGGRSWTKTHDFEFEYFSVRDMAVSPSDPDTIYVAGYGYSLAGSRIEYLNVVFKSSDGGESWSDLSDGVSLGEHQHFSKIAVDPADTNRVYALTRSLFYSSVDGGETWQLYNRRPRNPRTITVDPVNPGTVWICSDSVTYVSSDYGVNWRGIRHTFEGYPIAIDVSRGASSDVYISTRSGFYRTEDAGETWQTAHSGIHNSIVPALAVARSAPTTVYAEHQMIGVLLSEESGEDWTACQTFSSCGNVRALLAHLEHPERVLALADN